jgi:hypothetical protein
MAGPQSGKDPTPFLQTTHYLDQKPSPLTATITTRRPIPPGRTISTTKSPQQNVSNFGQKTWSK